MGMDQETARALAAPFPEHEVLVRMDRNGKPMKDDAGRPIEYLSHVSVERRLDEVLGAWSFEIRWQERGDEEITVRGRLEAEGMVKEQFGGAQIKRYSQGDRKGRPVDIGNDFKAAATDALKKCASLMGVGRYLMDKRARDEARRNPAPATGPDHPVGAEGEVPMGGVTESEAKAVFTAGRDSGATEEEILDAVEKRTGFRVLRSLTPAAAGELLRAYQPGDRKPF